MQTTSIPTHSFLSQIPTSVPKDGTNPEFTQSFDPITEMTQAKLFFEEWGFVVFKNVLSPDQLQLSVCDVFDYMESGAHKFSFARDMNKKCETQLKRDDMSTWTNSNWPSMKNEGIFGEAPVFTKQAMDNRQNETVYHVFKELIGREDLMVTMDRYGFFRPTKDVPIRSEQTGQVELKDFPSWKSDKNIHFDRNPWHYMNSLNPISNAFPKEYNYLPSFCGEYNEAGRFDDRAVKLQALINFVDNRDQDGGFILVPKFHKFFKEWVEATKNTIGKKYSGSSFLIMNRIDQVGQMGVRIPLRAGDMLVWDVCMPHGSQPNDSSQMRLCQFLKMYPAMKANKNRRAIINKALEGNGLVVTELGSKLFGLKEWN